MTDLIISLQSFRNLRQINWIIIPPALVCSFIIPLHERILRINTTVDISSCPGLGALLLHLNLHSQRERAGEGEFLTGKQRCAIQIN